MKNKKPNKTFSIVEDIQNGTKKITVEKAKIIREILFYKFKTRMPIQRAMEFIFQNFLNHERIRNDGP